MPETIFAGAVVDKGPTQSDGMHSVLGAGAGQEQLDDRSPQAQATVSRGGNGRGGLKSSGWLPDAKAQNVKR